jgi:predicted short-subunit dehydrogenase-like oxidoreductase (DUF2520 family)
MKLGLLGAGRAASTLAVLLERAGLPPAWRWARRSGEPLASLPEADVVLVAVSDAAIAEVARELARRSCAPREVWLHLSGKEPGALLRATPGAPRAAGSFHPLQALPGGPVPADYLRGVTAGLEGDPEALEAGRKLAEALEMRPAVIATDQKPLYHAAAVTVAGHLVALFSQGLEMLVAAGFDRESAQAALYPLARGALGALASRAPREAITGPISRGDAATVQGHLRAIDALDPELGLTYRALARTAMGLSAGSLTSASREALEALLRAPPAGSAPRS